MEKCQHALTGARVRVGEGGSSLLDFHCSVDDLNIPQLTLERHSDTFKC